MIVQFLPVSDELRTARDFRPLMDWCASMERDYPVVVVSRPAVLWYDRELLWDSLHLNAACVEKFMPVVAKDMQSVLGE